MIYVYRCEQCEQEFEVEQSITDEPLKTCTQIIELLPGFDYRCSGSIKRVPQKIGTAFKGEGFHVNDYK